MVMDLDKKKEFETPKLEIIEFTNDDIITQSGVFGNPDDEVGDI